VVKAGTTAALSAWTVEFDLPAGTGIGSAWEADMTRTGDHYRFVNRAYNGSVPAGGSTAFGFNGAGPGAPLNCTVNGSPCDGSSGGPDTVAPSVPGGLTAGDPTSTSVPLSWSAASDNVGVTAYEVFVGTQTTPRKTAWIKANGLGGAMIWSMDGDTANGELMTAVHQGIG
jgi:chitinase